MKYFALANDILGTYYTVTDPSEEVVAMTNEITNNDLENYPFYSYYTRYNSGALGGYSVPQFLSIYIDTYIGHPKAMTLHFMRRNSVLWSVVKPNEEIAGCVNYLGEYHIDPPTEYAYPYRVANRLTAALTWLASQLTGVSLIYVFAWRTGIYTLWLLFIMFQILRKKQAIILVAFVPAIFNAVALYAALGWTDHRYFWPIAVIALFLYMFAGVCDKRSMG